VLYLYYTKNNQYTATLPSLERIHLAWVLRKLYYFVVSRIFGKDDKKNKSIFPIDAIHPAIQASCG